MRLQDIHMRRTALTLAALVGLASTTAPAMASRGHRHAEVRAAYAALSGSARRQSVPPSAKAAREAGYTSLSELTGGAYPAFSPGIGTVYVRRESLPSGPFAAYDHKGRLVSTIYKFSLDRMVDKGTLEAQGIRMPPVDHVGGFFGGSHPGVDFPHYSLVFWHVSKKDEAKVAK